MSGISYPPPSPITPWPEFNSLQWVLSNSSVSKNYVDTTFLMLSGGNMNGPLNAINISVTGTLTSSGNITMTNTGSILTLSGQLKIPSNSLYINNINVLSSATQLNYLSGIINPGTAYASNALVLDTSLNIIGINNLTATTLTGTISTSSQPNITSLGNLSNLTMFGDIILSGHNILSVNSITATTLTGTISTATQTNITSLGTLSSLIVSGQISDTSTTDSSSVSTGAIITTGGIGIAKSLYVGSNINVSNAVGGNMLTLNCSSSTSRSTIYLQSDTQNWEFGCRSSSNSSNPNTLYIYNGSYKFLMDTTGDISILSTTNSTSYTNGALTIAGGVGIASNIYCNGTLNLNHNGSNIGFTNGSNSGLIELAASPDILRCVNGFAVNIGSAGVNIGSGSTRNPICPLDMGQTASNMIISLYNNTTNYYGISANNNATQISSATDVTMYSNCTNSSPINTLIATFSSGGNVIATAGFFSKGYSSTDLSGQGCKLHYGNNGSINLGQVFAYDYTNSVYEPLVLGNNNIQCGTNGFCNFNTTNVTTNAPISIFGSGSFTRTIGGYGWLSSAGSSTATANWTRNFALYLDSAGILVSAGEIDVFCDLRLKNNVKELDEELCDKFVNNINPISFYYKNNQARIHLGFSAQELIKYGFADTLIGVVDADISSNLESQDIECIDGKIFHLPADKKLSVSVLDIVPILTKALKNTNERIKELENKILIQDEQIKKNTNEIENLKSLFYNLCVLGEVV